MFVIDSCHIIGVNYLIIADRYSGCLSVLYVGSRNLTLDSWITVFRDYFAKFGVAAEISIDGASLRDFWSSMVFDTG